MISAHNGNPTQIMTDHDSVSRCGSFAKHFKQGFPALLTVIFLSISGLRFNKSAKDSQER